MSDLTPAAAITPPATLTVAQAAQKYAEAKAAGIANPLSEAARTLGQRGAQARQERQAQVAAQPQESPQEEEQQPENEPTDKGTPGETDDTAPPVETGAKPDEPAVQTIDLGEGVTVTLDEVRNGLMLKADHTRKTQELADIRRSLETERSQRLSQLDGIIGALQQKIGQPKTLSQWLAEDPVNGLEQFAKQADQIAEVNRARDAKMQAEQRGHTEAIDLRDRQLAESYNTAWADPATRDKDYTALTQFALQEGATPDEIRMMSKPWMIKILHKASKLDTLEANAAVIRKTVVSKPQVIKPGAKVSAQAAKSTSIQQGMERLKQSGSLADAVAVLRARRPG